MSDHSRAGGDPHAARESARYSAPIASREYILETLRDAPGPMDLEALGERLGLDADAEASEALRRRVRAMIRDGQLIENRRRGLVPIDDGGLVVGRVSAHRDGFGFLVSDERDSDIFLNAKQMRQVLNGDRAVVCIVGEDRRGRPEGRIVDVVERANRSIVGRLVVEHGVAIVLPDDKRIHQDLLIESGGRAGAEHGDMVVAEIVEQPTRRQQPLGRVVEVLGRHLTPGMEIDVALRSRDIPVEWPEAVTAQANAYRPTVEAEDRLGRKDVRAIPLVTIDGADARDFDDAVWCEPTEKGWRLLVAIADVAHYVEPGSALDAEALERGTSVYFPGRVVPMLPEVLSNGLCSLNPEVERLCMLCELSLGPGGAIRRARFHNGVMRSHARLTYSKVNEILSVPDSALREEHAELVPALENLHALYGVLAKARRKRGAIEFESTETRILFDDERKIREIVPIERNDAHRLIEECMILANIAAAAFVERHEVPALYRVHAGPKVDKLEDLRAFLALRGLALGGGESPSALDYARLSREIEDRPDRSVIQTVMLRSMQQAVYQPKNEGHFGLALAQYAHFTSPIRRYPDLLVHRAIKHVLSRAKDADYRYSNAEMQALGERCSMTERRAEEASRDVVSWLKCEYMEQHVGGEFTGVVSAVTSFGLFVELGDIHVEGLIHVTSLARDFYRFDAAAHALVGERTGQQYHLGDEMLVRVVAVNLDERKIDFAEVEHRPARRARGRPAKRSTRGAEGAARARDVVEGKGARKDKRPKRDKDGKRRERTEEKASPSPAAAAIDEAALAAAAAAEKRAARAERERKRREKRREKERRRAEKRAQKLASRRERAAEAGVPPPAAETADAAAPDAARAAKREEAANKPSATRKVAEKRVAKKTAAGKTASKKRSAREPSPLKGGAAKRRVAAEAAIAKAAADEDGATRAAAVKAPVAGKGRSKKGSAAKKPAGKAAATRRASAAKAVAAKAGAGGEEAARGGAAAEGTARATTRRKAVGKKVAAKGAARRSASGGAGAKKTTKKGPATARGRSAAGVESATGGAAGKKRAAAAARTKKRAARRASAGTGDDRSDG